MLFLFEFPDKDEPSECPDTEWIPCNPLIAQECRFLLIWVPGLFDSSYKHSRTFKRIEERFPHCQMGLSSAPALSS